MSDNGTVDRKLPPRKPPMSKAKALELAASIGHAHGDIEAVMYLFSGDIDDETILVLEGLLRDDDESAWDSIREMITREGSKPYPPNDIALEGGFMGVDSPYSEYLDLCDAYEVAFTSAVYGQVRRVADAIRAKMV